MPIEHWMMFGTFAEQKHFAYPREDSYSGVLISGNMAAYAPDGIAAFLIERTKNLAYVIDPLTHAFQHDTSAVVDDDDKPKKALKTLATAFGKFADDIIGTRPMLPSDLQDDIVLFDFVDNVLKFQRTQVSSRMTQNPNAKYLDSDDASRGPFALIPPYFFLTETSAEDWLPSMVKATSRAVELRGNGEKVYMSIVLSQGLVLNTMLRQKVIEKARSTGCDGFFLWVDGLDETKAGGDELKSLIEVGKSLRGEDHRPVINRHGGYFSSMAAGAAGGKAFTGIMHGPEFGEFRSVVPVGGGIPIAKYYIPLLHARVKYRDALRYLTRSGWLENTQTFFDKVCDCQECKQVIGEDAENFTRFGESISKTVKRKYGPVSMEYPTTETKLRCLRHYLQRKTIECEFCERASVEQVAAELDNGISAFEPVAGRDGVDHLRLWKRVLLESTT